MNKSKKYGKGDLYDQRKLLPKIMNYLHCDSEKAKEVFNKLKEDANKEIPDFNKYINKKMAKKKYPVVEIEWFDAQTHSGYAEDIGKLEEWHPCLTKSIGYLLHKDKEKIILGFMIFQDEQEINSVKHCQMIPMGMIKKINQLKGVKNGK